MEKELANKLCKIAIVGPESTGKSLMSRRLAAEFQTLFVPEYARYYCQDLDNKYTLQDELNMYYGQIALEDSLMEVLDKPLLFCDTTILTVKVWSDYLFGKTPAVVLNEIKNRIYDFYLLMDFDLPWEDDPLRDFPNQREYFMEVWKKELSDLNAEFTIIRGVGEVRYHNGIKAVNRFIKAKVL